MRTKHRDPNRGDCDVGGKNSGALPIAPRATKHRDPNRGDCDWTLQRQKHPENHSLAGTKHRHPNRGDCDKSADFGPADSWISCVGTTKHRDPNRGDCDRTVLNRAAPGYCATA